MKRIIFVIVILSLYNCKYLSMPESKYIETYYPDSTLQAAGNLLLPDSVKQNRWYFYYDNGDTMKVVDYKRGEIHGLYKVFDKNGGYSMGIKHGNMKIGYWQSRDSVGNLEFYETYNDSGLLDGDAGFFEDGKLKLTRKYDNGEIVSERYFTFDEEGNYHVYDTQ